MKSKTIKLMQLFYLIFYMGIGVYTTYITVFFKAKGLTASEIGAIQGIGPVVSMIGLSLAGSLADRTGKMNIVLSASFLLSAVCDIFFPISPVFMVLLFINTFYTFASSPLLQLADAFAADNCNKEDYPFNKVKICGTVGYASAVLLSGYILKNNVSLMFVIQGIIFLVSSVLAYKIPDRRTIKEPAKNAYFTVLKEKKILVLYMVNLLIYIPVSYYNSFFPIFVQELAQGDITSVSWSNFLAHLSEFPFLLSAFVIFKKFGAKKLLMLSCALMTIRWLVTAIAPNLAVAMIINMLKGASDIVFVYCTTEILNRTLDDRLKGTGQAIFGIITYGIARIAGNWLGGILTDFIGIRAVFSICSAFPLAAFFALMFLYKDNKKATA